jgi:2-C-methyl-D-erythritol 4-phosphate cytidylyltransferase
MPTFAVILVAAGRSTRFSGGETKKPFVSLQGKPVWVRSAEKFAARPEVRQLIIVVAKEDRDYFEQADAHWIEAFGVSVVIGGDERTDSVANGLAAVDSDVTHVAIHDAARPCVSPELIESTFDAATQHKCVTPAVPINSTVKRSTDGGQTIAETVDRSELYLSQTPQVFARETIIELF